MSSSIWFLASIMEKLIRVTLRKCQSMIRMCFALSPSTGQTRNSKHYLRWWHTIHHHVILALFLHKHNVTKLFNVFTESITYYSEGLSLILIIWKHHLHFRMFYIVQAHKFIYLFILSMACWLFIYFMLPIFLNRII